MHEIDSMFYTGEKPWHQLGVELDHVATSAEALIAAKLDWTVSKQPLFLNNLTEVPDHFAVVRDDSNEPLGVVGNAYRPLQNKEAFSFFDAVVGEKAAMYHTAGSLRGGQYVWILAKLPGIIRVVGDDIVEKYLLLTNVHNGTRAARMLFTPIRVVCMNTHNVAISLANAAARAASMSGQAVTGQARMMHSKNIGEKVTEVRNQLGIVSAQYQFYAEAAQRLAAVSLTNEAWGAYLQRVGIAPELKAGEKIPTVTQNIIDEVSAMFDKGRGNDMPGVKHTAWGAFNAVTEYVDYARASDKNDKRAHSILFGTGATLKQKAWDAALQIAGGVR